MQQLIAMLHGDSGAKTTLDQIETRKVASGITLVMA
jgi:hypothetical protein